MFFGDRGGNGWETDGGRKIFFYVFLCVHKNDIENWNVLCTKNDKVEQRGYHGKARIKMSNKGANTDRQNCNIEI